MLNKIFMALSSICTECETLVNEVLPKSVARIDPTNQKT